MHLADAFIQSGLTVHSGYTFNQGALLRALASDKRIGDLHAFSVDSDCIHFGPGDCGVIFWPRIKCLKSLSTPFRTQTVSLAALLLSRRPHVMRTLRFLVPRQGFEDLHRPFGQLSAIWPAILCATVVVRRAVSKQRLPTGLWDAIKAAYTSQGWNAPCTLGSTQQGLSPSVRVLRGMSIQIYALQPAVFSEYLCQVLQAGRSVLGLLSAVGEWLIHVYATSIHVCLLPHTVITLYSLYAIVAVVCPVLSAAPVIQCIFYWCTIMFCVYCCLTQLSLWRLSQCCCFCFCPVSQSKHTFITDQICKFRIPGLLDAHWLISTYQLRVRLQASLLVGIVCVCSIFASVVTCTGCS